MYLKEYIMGQFCLLKCLEQKKKERRFLYQAHLCIVRRARRDENQRPGRLA